MIDWCCDALWRDERFCDWWPLTLPRLSSVVLCVCLRVRLVGVGIGVDVYANGLVVEGLVGGSVSASVRSFLELVFFFFAARFLMFTPSFTKRVPTSLRKRNGGRLLRTLKTASARLRYGGGDR